MYVFVLLAGKYIAPELAASNLQGHIEVLLFIHITHVAHIKFSS
jgi:hypothetical protein